MPAQALYRKWRPQLWDEVYGQEPVAITDAGAELLSENPFRPQGAR